MKKLSGKRVLRAWKGFTLFISNKDINGIIKVVESLENSVIFIDGATETAKQEGGFLGAMMGSIATSSPMTPLLIKPVASSLINAVTGKG